MEIAILFDFDGTIITKDSCVYLLENFTKGDWRKYDDLYEENKITLEEAMKAQFKMINLTNEQVIEKLQDWLTVRPGFRELITYCKNNRIKLEICSAGLSFVIEDFLKQVGYENVFNIVTADIQLGKNFHLILPDFNSSESNNFKEDRVKQYQEKGYYVIYLGDGPADYDAASTANDAFAIENSTLHELLEKNNDKFSSINSFNEVIGFLKERRF